MPYAKNLERAAKPDAAKADRGDQESHVPRLSAYGNESRDGGALADDGGRPPRQMAKNEGDAVATGDVLAEVETDKAVMELVARGDGVLRKRLANEGDASPVGTLLAVIGTADENIDSIIGGAAPPQLRAGSAAAPAAAAAKPAQENAAPESSDQSQAEATAPPQAKAAAPAPVQLRPHHAQRTRATTRRSSAAAEGQWRASWRYCRSGRTSTHVATGAQTRQRKGNRARRNPGLGARRPHHQARHREREGNRWRSRSFGGSRKTGDRRRLQGHPAHPDQKNDRAPSLRVERSRSDILPHRGIRRQPRGGDACPAEGDGRRVQGLVQRHRHQSGRAGAGRASGGQRALDG